MKKSELVKLIQEEMRGYSPQIGQTKGLTPQTLNQILLKIAKSGEEEDELDEGMMFYKNILLNLLPKGPETEYLLPDLVKTLNDFYANHDLDIKVMGESEQAGWPEEVESRYGEYVFKLIKTASDRAKYAVIDVETGEEEGTLVFNTPERLKVYANDLIKPQGGRQSSHFGTQESKNTEEAITPIGSSPNRREEVASQIADTLKGEYSKYGLDREDGHVKRKASRAGQTPEEFMRDQREFFIEKVFNRVKEILLK